VVELLHAGVVAPVGAAVGDLDVEVAGEGHHGDLGEVLVDVHHDHGVGAGGAALLVDAEDEDVEGPLDVLDVHLGAVVAEDVLGLDGVVRGVGGVLGDARGGAGDDHGDASGVHHQVGPPGCAALHCHASPRVRAASTAVFTWWRRPPAAPRPRLIGGL